MIVWPTTCAAGEAVPGADSLVESAARPARPESCSRAHSLALAKHYQLTGETELARQSLEKAHEYVPEYAAVSEELAKYDAAPEQE